MAKLSEAARPYYKPHFTMGSWIFVLGITLTVDVIKFAIDLIPGIDLIDLPLSIVAFLILNLYFLLKLGASFLGGKRAGQKIFTELATLVVSAIPILDGLAFETTINAAAIMWATDEEDKESAEEQVAVAHANAAAQIKQAEYVQFMQQRQLAMEEQAAQDAAEDAAIRWNRATEQESTDDEEEEFA